MKHIMIPYDESEHAKRAFEFTLDLAKKYNSSVTIVACVPISFSNDPYFAISYGDTQKLLRENAKNSILKLEPKLKELSIPFKTEVLDAISTTETLVSYAESNDVDLIVMGSRGLGGFKKLLLGSVASGVSQHSKCPVLIVK